MRIVSNSGKIEEGIEEFQQFGAEILCSLKKKGDEEVRKWRNIQRRGENGRKGKACAAKDEMR